MNIPERVRKTLQAIGLTPAEWRSVQQAFSDSQAVVTPQGDSRLLAAIEEAEALIRDLDEVAARVFLDRELTLKELHQWVLVLSWIRWGHLGLSGFCKKMNISHSSFYRMRNNFGFEQAATLTLEGAHSALDRLQQAAGKPGGSDVQSAN